MAFKFKKDGKVKIIKGRLKGETAIAEGKRCDANWNSMVHIRRANPNARDTCIQIASHYLENLYCGD